MLDLINGLVCLIRDLLESHPNQHCTTDVIAKQSVPSDIDTLQDRSTAWLHGETAQSSTAGYTPVVQPMCRFELSRWLQHNPCARYRTQPGKVSPCDAWESL